MAAPASPESPVLAIGGMTCEHCERRVREALEAVPGVAGARVSLATGSAVVRLAAPVAAATLVAAVEAAGYAASPRAPRRRVPLPAFLAALAAVVALGWLLTRAFGVNAVALLPDVGASATLGALLLAGLFTSLHCAGMCGARTRRRARRRPPRLRALGRPEGMTPPPRRRRGAALWTVLIAVD